MGKPTYQIRGTILYLVDEYRSEMQAMFAKYLTPSPPQQPMIRAIAEVKERYQARCEKLGIEWDDVQEILDRDLGLSTSKVKRLKDISTC